MATAPATPKTTKQSESNTTLALIAIFKLIKAVFLVGVGVGAFRLINRDIAVTITHWVNVLRVDPDNRFLHGLLSRILHVSPNQLRALGIGTFVYAALLSVEGAGLLLRKRWAEYFTIISTAGLIPLEVYEIARHLTAGKIFVLLINVAIVIYLCVRVRRRSAGTR